MPYMANVNKIIFWVFVPSIITLYIVFRIIEWSYMDDGGRATISKQHLINLENSNGINCLILGGSNAVFSLSAKQMSKEDNLNCYNMSLVNEGYSDEAYFDFIRKAPIDKNNIKHIFYSSVIPLSSEHFSKRLEHNNNETPLYGEQPFEVIGPSIASYFIKWVKGEALFKTKQYPKPTLSGDFNFSAYDRCTSEPIIDKWDLDHNNEALIFWVEKQLLRVRNIFTNAELYFLIPSTLNETYNEKDVSSFLSLLEKEIPQNRIAFIKQSPYENINFLCDYTHHANAIGREVRTKELITIIADFK